MLKYTTYLQKKLGTLFEELDYKVMYEKGNFQAGYCLVENKKIIVVNKFFDVEAKINCLMDILGKIEVDEERLEPKSKDLYRKVVGRKKTKEGAETNKI